ncbi:hypothetical protein F4677DRAFT_448275 [Hypoxylon crocopeplum]|nr:hypothetical protein F4677DRAFT_448275 [Hypoxylon crocopeplum]
MSKMDDHHDTPLFPLPFPTELFHIIWSCMSPSQARESRLCCKTFANIGACYGFAEITFCFCQPDFDKLRHIASHPTLSKKVKGLTCEIAKFYTLPGTFPLNFEEYMEEAADYSNQDRVMSYKKNWIPDGAFNNAPIREEDILENFEQYERTFEDHRSILEDGCDLFKEVLPKFTNLKQLVLDNRPTTRILPFDGLLAPTTPSTYADGQLSAIMGGLRNPGIKLRSIRGIELDPRTIDLYLFDDLGPVRDRLTSIELEFKTEAEDVEDADEPDEPPAGSGYDVMETRRQTDAGRIAECLRDSPGLESMSITFTSYLDDEVGFPAGLSHVIPPGFKWNDLREVRLQYIEMERQDLFTFLQLHRETLRTIRLDDIKLTSTSWVKLLRQMKQTLQLQKIHIAGHLCGKFEEGEDGFDEGYDEVEQEWWVEDPLCQRLADWFLHNEDFPLIPFRRIV